MDTDDEQAAQLIRQGKYFQQSRQWYQALYIGPISERSFFLVLALLAGLVGLVGFIAFVGLMPLTSRPAIVIANPRMDDTIPQAIRLRGDDMTVNEALRQFNVITYVLKREGYTATSYPGNVAFISAHSDAPTAEAYLNAFGRNNPRAPVNLLGESNTRSVEIQSVHINTAVEPQVATVRFSTELGGTIAASKTQWTATIQFYYSDAAVADAVDPTTGEVQVNVQEPVFQVVNYALTQS